MPVIVLKGHTSEVTTVDWNPFDQNQCITCSDDNTIRVWNVRREMDLITSKEGECNFTRAEQVNEFESMNNNNNEANQMEVVTVDRDIKTEQEVYCENTNNYISTTKFNSRIYNKYRPHMTTLYDDYFWLNFENRNFKYIPTCSAAQPQKTDLENDLCARCENINIDNENNAKLLNKETMKNISFIDLKTNPLSNLPINLIETINTDADDKIRSNGSVTHPLAAANLNEFIFRRQASSSTLLSVSSNNNINNSAVSAMPKCQPKVLSRKKNTAKTLSNNNNCSSPCSSNPDKQGRHFELTNTPTRFLSQGSSSTAKKRNAVACLREDGEQFENDSTEPRTPQSKRRLVMPSAANNHNNTNETTPNNKPSCSSMAAASPIRTILHYFSPKATGK